MSSQQFKLLLVKSIAQRPEQQQHVQQPLSFPPPPAYTAAAPASPSISQSLNAQPQASTTMASSNNTNGINPLFAAPNLNMSQHQSQIPSRPQLFPAVALDQSASENNDDEPTSPSITISIHTPIAITGDNNVLAFNPADTGAALAKAFIGALRESSMSEAGIPMIDQDGVPRTIHVNVVSGIEVKGAGNRVGANVAAELPKVQIRGVKRAREEHREENGDEDWETAEIEGERESKVKKVQ